jgi:hypothetical protein
MRNKTTANLSSELNLSFLIPLSKQLDLDQFATEKLARSLTRIWIGNNDIYRTPFAKELSDQELFKSFESEVMIPNAGLMNTVLKDLELAQKDKYGPRSIAKPWAEWRDVFLGTFRDKESINLDVLIRNVAEPGQVNNLRPLSIGNASLKLRNKTSSGLPAMLKKGIVKSRAADTWTISKVSKYPSVLYTRTQESSKIRGVWGFPIDTILLEAQFYYPLLEVMRGLKWRSSLRGPEAIAVTITRLIDKAVRLGKFCVSIDISAFDSSVQPKLSYRAFGDFAGYFQNGYLDQIRIIAKESVSKPIVTPDGLIEGLHGEASGSNFTNELDSHVHKNVVIDYGISLDDFDIQGDDGAIIVDDEDTNAIFEHYLNNGFTVNKEKSYVFKDGFVYLQNLFHVDYRSDDGIIRGIYPIWRALNRIRFQEKWSQFEDEGILGKDYYSIRAITILENCRYHPLYTELVKFVLEHDKYSLEFSENGLAKYVEFVLATEGNRGDFSNQVGDDIKGIKSFETVSLIKRLSA